MSPVLANLPPRPRGWSPRRTYTGGCDEAVVMEPVSWRDCVTCWGQGRIIDAALTNAYVCGTCLGVGSVAR